MKRLLWLDNIRDPLVQVWLTYSPIPQPFEAIWVKSYKEFIKWIEINGLPDAICFDHDLADICYDLSKGKEMFVLHEKTGMDCAKWLVEYCLDKNCKLPLYNIQSANPTGKDNINSLLKNYNKHYENSTK